MRCVAGDVHRRDTETSCRYLPGAKEEPYAGLGPGTGREEDAAGTVFQHQLAAARHYELKLTCCLASPKSILLCSDHVQRYGIQNCVSA